jgi:hypothetical protein
MAKRDVHVKLDPDLAEAIQRYARGHGITFTAALSLLAARGLRDDGITIRGDGDNDNQPAVR